MAVTYRNKISDFRYEVTGNISFNKNKIEDLSGSDNMIQNGGDKIRYILKEGESIGSFYGYKTAGLYTQKEIDEGHYYTLGRKPNAGDIKYVPQRDNVEWGSAITDEDRTIIGCDVPKFTYGLNLNLGYKDFELSLFGQGVAGAKVAFEYGHSSSTPTRASSTLDVGPRPTLTLTPTIREFTVVCLKTHTTRTSPTASCSAPTISASRPSPSAIACRAHWSTALA